MVTISNATVGVTGPEVRVAVVVLEAALKEADTALVIVVTVAVDVVP